MKLTADPYNGICLATNLDTYDYVAPDVFMQLTQNEFLSKNIWVWSDVSLSQAKELHETHVINR